MCITHVLIRNYLLSEYMTACTTNTGDTNVRKPYKTTIKLTFFLLIPAYSHWTEKCHDTSSLPRL